MELKYLNTFKTILETGSFQKAAEQLNYAQSTVTLQIQMIEKELSVKLFNKIGRKMELTQEGKELVPYIRNVLDAVQQMESYGKSEKELVGTLRIAIPETFLTYQIQPVIKKFREQAPNVKLSLQIPNCYIIRDQVMNGSIDLGIHYDVGGYGSSIVVEKMSSYPLALVGSTKLEKEECNFINKGQRKNICLLTVDKGSIYNKFFNEYLKDYDIILNGEMEIGSIEAIKGCVYSNLGVAYLPRYAVQTEIAKEEIKELDTDLSKEVTVVCTYHKNKWITPAMKLFINLLKEQMEL